MDIVTIHSDFFLFSYFFPYFSKRHGNGTRNLFVDVLMISKLADFFTSILTESTNLIVKKNKNR